MLIKKTYILFLLITILFCPILLATEVKKGDICSISNIVEKTLPCIVSISGIRNVTDTDDIEESLFDIMDNLDEEENKKDNTIEKIGSGVIIDAKKGYIVTNAHVISELDQINVMLNDRRILRAKLIGMDSHSDLALLRIREKNIEVTKIANSDNVKVGDFVIAIGNPYGFSHTTTQGIVSALCRNNISLNTNGYYNFIQTDAAINQGNSGGGLFDIKGRLIGINTAMVTTKQGGNMGLGLSIPSNMVRIISSQLKKGKVHRATLGLSSQDITNELSMTFEYFKYYGAIISQIYPDTAAHQSDLQVGDIITHINKKKIIDSMHLRITISLIIPNKKIEVSVFRKKRLKKFILFIKSPHYKKIIGAAVFKGLGKSELVEKEYTVHTKIRGIIINEIDNESPITESTLKAGDLVIAANKVLTPTIDILKRVALKHEKVLLLQVIRENTKFFTVVKDR